MLSVPFRMSPKSTWIILKQALGLWMMLGYQHQPSHCLPMPSKRMPGTSCCKLPMDRERGEETSEWETMGDLEKTQLLNENVSKCAQFVKQTILVCLRCACACVCRWTHRKCSQVMETDVGYATAWLSSHYIITVSFRYFSSHTLSPLFQLPV